MSVDSAATSLPSFVAPSLTFIFVPEVGPVASKTSFRDICTFTGWPLLRESRAATGSAYSTVFAPKPPPISSGMALTSATGMPMNRAVWSRTVNCPWLLDQMVSLPSGPHWAVPAWGSM